MSENEQSALPTKRKQAELIAEAIDYKLQGHSYEQIAEQMGLNLDNIRRIVQSGLRKLTRDTWRERFLLDLQRNDQMLAAVYPSAAQGDREAINTVNALREDREKIQREFDRQTSFELLCPPQPEELDVTTNNNAPTPIQSRRTKARERRSAKGNAE